MASCSRIAALPADVSEGILRELEGSFAGVQELHLGNAGVNWTEVRTRLPVLTSRGLTPDHLLVPVVSCFTGTASARQSVVACSVRSRHGFAGT
jgi:hypothetical protein